MEGLNVFFFILGYSCWYMLLVVPVFKISLLFSTSEVKTIWHYINSVIIIIIIKC